MTISISSPSSGASVSGTINVVGTSSQTVTGGAGSTPQNLASQAFSVPYNTTLLSNGVQTLSAGNGVSTASVSVNVSNVVASPDGTTIPSASSITDSSGNSWTVVGGVVKENGSNAGFSSSVTLLLWYSGVIWQKNSSNLWWPWNGTAWTGSGVGDPRPSSAPTIKFWGCNGHINLGGPYANNANQIASLVDLGFGSYRSDYYLGDSTSFLNFITAAAGAVNLYPVLVCDPGTSESNSYTIGHALGVDAAALMGKVPGYEVGNELDMAAITANDGTVPTDYNNTAFAKARGLINGMVDGIRSIDTTTPITLGAIGWLHFGFNDMILNGHGPDGSTGHQIPNVQNIAYHWYSDMDDMESATGGSGTYNVLSHAHGWGKPLWITEYGVRPDYGTETSMSSYLTGSLCMTDWYSKAATYNIAHCAMYNLYDDSTLGGDGDYGLLLVNGSTHKGRYAGVKTLIAAHPM